MVLVAVLSLLLFMPMSATAQQPAPEVNEPPPIVEAEETVIVTATRTNTRLQDQPVRVEVIDREEIEEKAMMTPGSVAMRRRAWRHRVH
jgi:iron complex outermembrane receptor protein